jgi:hypothetical protein
MVHRTLSDAPARRPLEPANLGKMDARSAIIHRTVRCATRLSSEPAEQRLTCANGRLQKVLCLNITDAEVRGHRTVRCRKMTKVPTVDQLQTLTVALTWSAPDSHSDSPVRPSPAEFSQQLEVVGRL